MDEYIVGQTYFFEGKPFTYKGGDPSVRESWADGIAKVADPSTPERPRGTLFGKDRVHVPVRSPVTDASIGLNAFQGLTANFGDEILGTILGAISPSMTTEEGREKMRELLDVTQKVHPVISASSNVGGAALPAGRVGQAVSHIAGPVARVTASTLAGATGGLLFGAGEAEGSLAERVRAGTGEAVTGGLLGLVLPPAAAGVSAFRKAGGEAGTRVARALEKTTGITREMNQALGRIEQNIQNVRRQAYAPLEESFAAIDDPEILSLLRSPAMRQHANAIRRGLGRGRLPAGKQAVRPSFEDLQKLRGRLGNGRNADRDLHKQLDALMKERLPGLAEADQAYFAAQSAKRALSDGRKSLNMNAQDIERRLAGQTQEVRDAFNTGRMFRIVAKLEERSSNAPQLLRTFLDAGPETRARLRTMFPSDEAFAEFEAVLRKEKSAAKIARTAKRLMIPLAAGAAGGLGFAAMRSTAGGQ